MSYCKNCGAELPADAKFCSSCGTRITTFKSKPVETHRSLKVSGKPKVVVTNTAFGSVKVNAGAVAEVVVDLDLKKPEDLDWKISQDGDVVTVTCRVKAPVLSWPMYIFSGGPKANISISVPSESDLDLENSVGQVEVAGVKGTLNAESNTGKITIQNCEGTVKARTKTGIVNLENVNGTVSVRNFIGSIIYTGALSTAENWFRTTTGNIELTLRGTPDLTVEASTMLGRIACSPELTDARYERGQYRGQLGGGSGRLLAETTTGSIRINR